MKLFLEEFSRCHQSELILLISDKARNHSKKGLKIPENIIIFHL